MMISLASNQDIPGAESNGDDRSGSIATGSSEQQVRPCPVKAEVRGALAAAVMPLQVNGDALNFISSQHLLKGDKVPVFIGELSILCVRGAGAP
jgi:hypothetical protein